MTPRRELSGDVDGLAVREAGSSGGIPGGRIPKWHGPCVPRSEPNAAVGGLRTLGALADPVLSGHAGQPPNTSKSSQAQSHPSPTPS